ncbi:hypothetical protein ACFO26_08140 [Lactococcus nasutitermitis]|uniref:Lipoprotein n=1 Tax=Lactococcus nasutitermitis TaxID=1652957 RepID=A0ABV9JHS5_9LACT|nr:hypothetical protein [Lactococcus nasutitermitis]
MKMKKTILAAGAIALATFSLSACSSSKNSDAAKKAFINDVTELNNKSYNSDKVTMKINSFNATGENSTDLNKYLKNSTFDINVQRDSQNKAASLDGSVTVDGKDYNLGLIMNEAGIYVNSADVKSLFNTYKSQIPGNTGEDAQVYNAMFKGLTTPYFLIDEETMDAGLKASDSSTGVTSWSSELNSLFSQSTASKSDLTKAFKDVDNSDFSQSGDTVTAKISAKNGDLDDVIKGAASVNSSISEAQLKKILKGGKSDTSIKSLSIVEKINSKTHKSSSVITGKIEDKKAKDTVSFKISVNSQVAKVKSAVKVPSASQAKTIQDLEQSAIDSMTQQSLQATT